MDDEGSCDRKECCRDDEGQGSRSEGLEPLIMPCCYRLRHSAVVRAGLQLMKSILRYGGVCSYTCRSTPTTVRHRGNARALFVL